MYHHRISHTLVAYALVLGLGLSAVPAAAQAEAVSSRSNAFWFWNPHTVVGQTELTRSYDGLKARIKINAGKLAADQVITLWFIVFNSPGGCLTSPCTPADLFNPNATADFLYGSGTVTTARKVEFGGSLATAETSGSGFVEFGLGELAQGVSDPFGAEVLLALHSHGPAASGDALKAQISSFLGGCAVFLPGPGPDNGFAFGPEDVPDAAGECSTIIVSMHQP